MKMYRTMELGRYFSSRGLVDPQAHLNQNLNGRAQTSTGGIM